MLNIFQKKDLIKIDELRHLARPSSSSPMSLENKLQWGFSTDFKSIKKITALILLVTFPFTQMSWGDLAQPIQMQDGNFQAVADPFDQNVQPPQAAIVNDDFLNADSPLSPPSPPSPRSPRGAPPATPAIVGTAFNQTGLDQFNQLFRINTSIEMPLRGDQDATASVNTLSPSEFQFNFNLPDADDSARAVFAGGVFDTSMIEPRDITIDFDGDNLKISATGRPDLIYQLEYKTSTTDWKVAKTGLQVDALGHLTVIDDGKIRTPEGILLAHPFVSEAGDRQYRFTLASEDFEDLFDTSAIDPKDIQIDFEGSGLKLSATGLPGYFYQMEYKTDTSSWLVAKDGLQVDARNQLAVLDDGHIQMPGGQTLPNPFEGESRTYRFVLTPGQVPRYLGETVNVGPILTLGLEGPANKQITAQIFDVLGRRYEVPLNLTGLSQNYAIDLSHSNLDYSQIAMIRFRADAEHFGSSGSVRIFSKLTHSIQTLPDGTVLTYENDFLKSRVEPSGNRMEYSTQNGTLQRVVMGNGQKILVYLQDAQHTILIQNSAGEILKTIVSTPPHALDLTAAVKMTSAGGLETFYLNGNLIATKTASGILIYNLVMSAPASGDPEILDAVMRYPDGTIDIIWNKILMRRIYSSGLIADYLPDGSLARELNGSSEETYTSIYNAAGILAGLTITSNLGDKTIYDEKGILREVYGHDGKRLIYDRMANGNDWITRLNTVHSMGVTSETFSGGIYAFDGVIKELNFRDGRRLFFENGLLIRALDENGHVANYSTTEINGWMSELTVTRGASHFVYSDTGTLSQIQTAHGTITREIDQNGQVQLILDAIGGYRLTDFELDANGNILNGLVRLNEGMTQRIENGVLTAIEMADGRKYNVLDGGTRAELDTWTFQNGLVVKYGGVGIERIIFPNRDTLDQIQLTPDKEIQSYRQVDNADGTQRFYENNKLVKIITPAPASIEIIYNASGYAVRAVRTVNGVRVEDRLENEFDAEGHWLGVKILTGTDVRDYDAEGRLTHFITAGMQAQIENGQIQELSTMFGRVQDPTFTAGKLNGSIQLNDERILIVENGVLKKVELKNGNWVEYQNGRASAVHTAEGDYALTYLEINGNLQDIKVNWTLKDSPPVSELVIETTPMIPQGNPQSAAAIAGFNNAVHFDGNDSLSFYDASALNLGTGDFTIDFRTKFESITDGQFVTLLSRDSGSDIRIARNASNQLEVYLEGTQFLFDTFKPVANEWYHLSFVRKGGQINFYVNGRATSQIYTSNQNLQGTAPLILASTLNGYFFYGLMDEFRISDVARWDADFTPLTQAYTVDKNTKLLHHFDDLGRAESGHEVLNEEVKVLHGEMSLARYLLENPDSEFARIVSPRPTHDLINEGISLQLPNNFLVLRDLTLNGAIQLSSDNQGFVFTDTDNSIVVSGPGIIFGRDDFTIEATISLDAIKNDIALMASGWRWRIDAQDQKVRLLTTWSGTSIEFATGAWETGRSYEVAIVRRGNQLSFFRDGVMEGGIQATTDYYGGSSGGSLIIGNDFGIDNFKGRFDRLRVSAGIGRYDENYTVPQTYERDLKTLVLLNFDLSEWTARKETVNYPPNLIDVQKWFNDSERGEVVGINGILNSSMYRVDNNDALNCGNSNYIERNCQTGPADHLPALTTELIDMDGDGDSDRVSSLGANFKYWLVEKFEDNHFLNPERWEGVDAQLLPLAANGNLLHYDLSALRFYDGRHPTTLGDLVDINGDGLPDRLIVSVYGDRNWYVQFNNGHGFDAAEVWADNAQPASYSNPIGAYALSTRDDTGDAAIQPLISDLIDLDGDGLLDRVVRPSASPTLGADPFDHWFFQKNNGHGFDDAVIWNGVDHSFNADPKIGGALSWYTYKNGMMADTADLIDMNGDHRPDRILLRLKNYNYLPDPSDGAYDWYIQNNNGHGFDPAVLWDDTVRTLPDGAPRVGTSIRAFNYSGNRSYSVFLADVTGDGLPDRITLGFISFLGNSLYSQGEWTVEENNGMTFRPPVTWGIAEGDEVDNNPPSQDNENFMSYSHPNHTGKTFDLVDLNNDGKLDRVFLKASTGQWVVQYGTGSGFLPSRSLRITAVSHDKPLISEKYDTIHISLRAVSIPSGATGKVQVRLLDGNYNEVEQWAITNPSTSWMRGV